MASLHCIITAEGCTVEHENHYHGFAEIRTQSGMTIYIIGAPRLYARSYLPGVAAEEIINIHTGNAAAASLLQELLKVHDINTWGDYVTGTFAMFVSDPAKKRCFLITDLGNAFHVYSGWSADRTQFVLSTTIDCIAAATGKTNAIDLVSLVEYCTYDIITYPYTCYRDIREVSFATCLTSTYGDRHITVTEHQYWAPSCTAEESSSDIDGLAEQLRSGITQTAEAVLAHRNNVGVFLSGGLDSRVLAELVARYCGHGTALTISDDHNTETDIAKRTAEANHLEHVLLFKDPEFFPRTADAFIAQEGATADFSRSIFLGFRDTIQSYNFNALLGGYMADSLLRLHEANVKGRRFLGRHLGVLEQFDTRDARFLRGGAEYIKQFSFLFKSDLLDAALARRTAIFDYWSTIRTDGSAWEWTYLWPYTQNKHYNNLTTHIFNYQSFEVYTDRSIIEVARIASQKIKMNGRLFNRAVYPLVKNTRRIPLVNMMLPPASGWRWREVCVALLHLLPRRWVFPDQQYPLQSPVASNRTPTDLMKLWEHSTLLRQWRAEYGASGMEKEVLLPHQTSVFDRAFYRDLPKTIRYHIMYALLHFDRWRTLGQHRQPEDHDALPRRQR